MNRFKRENTAAVHLVQCTRAYSTYPLYVSKELSSPTQFLYAAHGKVAGRSEVSFSSLNRLINPCSHLDIMWDWEVKSGNAKQ